MNVYRAFVPADLKNIRRDPLLAWVGLLPFALALFYRLVPLLRDALLARFAFDLEPYYPLVASSFVTAAPGIAGMVVGFLLLDERDDGVLAAIAVTPVSPAAYLAYRLFLPLLAGFAATALSYPLLGFTPLAFGDLLAISAVASLIAPFTALFLAVFAQNKVSGFAMVKVLNVIGIAPVAAWFVAEPLQWLAGIAPSYWPMKMLWRAAEGRAYGVYALGGVVASGATIAALFVLFRRRVA
jgi:fluoroquinolone transport system permease protein